MRQRRWRTVLLWVGWTLSVLMLAAFMASWWWRVELQVPTPYGPTVYIEQGAIQTYLDEDPSFDWARMNPLPGRPFWGSHLGAGAQWVSAPLYALLLAVALPTLLVWRFVPKFPRGHCLRCGYNLTGNTSGVCPECGVEVQA